MKFERITIKIRGKELAATEYGLLESAIVEQDERMADVCRLRFSIGFIGGSGRWELLDEPAFRVWNTLQLHGGFSGSSELLFSGYITHVKPHLASDGEDAHLEITAQDRSVLMDREETAKIWNGQSDSEIARRILRRYFKGIDRVSVDSARIFQTNVVQNESDARFVRRLAERNGMQFYIEGDRAFFQRPRPGNRQTSTLALNFGKDTNLRELSIDVNALTPAQIAASGMLKNSREVKSVVIRRSSARTLGAEGVDDLLQSGVKTALRRTQRTPFATQTEMKAIAANDFSERQWAVIASGEIDGNAYGSFLRPRRTTPIKGCGRVYSGLYYITQVTHEFSADGYRAYFRAKRNALGVTGWEAFHR
jgi:phage protein D